MTVWWTLAWHSAWNRRFVLSLTALAVALSTFVLLSIARIRADVQDSFAQAVSGTDLIVGARTSPIELLMYSVFRVGGVSRNIKESSLDAISAHRAVAWVVLLSLGDSHKGHPVLATTQAYFDRFRYGEDRPLEMAQGRRFEKENEAVLGADVAARLGYKLGDELVLSHGDGALEESDHGDHPIVVSGILKPTGTPVDRSVHIDLEAMDDMHGGPLGAMLGLPGGLAGRPAFDDLQGISSGQTSGASSRLMPGESAGVPEQATGHADQAHTNHQHASHAHPNRQITAALVGLKNRAAVFSVQREVNTFRGEPMMAILPGVVLDELWSVVNSGERALWLVSGLVAVVSLLGLMATILASLDARRRELAILRALGAGPGRIGFLLALEGMLVSVIGICVGVAASLLGTHFAADTVRRLTGVGLHTGWLTAEQWPLIGAVLACAMLVCLVPGWRAFRLALQDGLTPRT